MFKSLVQRHLDYCSQMWFPSGKEAINKIVGVQRSLISRISDRRLAGANYWDKLRVLRLYSQESRRERYLIIFIWIMSQGLVDILFLLPLLIPEQAGKQFRPVSVSLLLHLVENHKRVPSCST